MGHVLPPFELNADHTDDVGHIPKYMPTLYIDMAPFTEHTVKDKVNYLSSSFICRPIYTYKGNTVTVNATFINKGSSVLTDNIKIDISGGTFTIVSAKLSGFAQWNNNSTTIINIRMKPHDVIELTLKIILNEISDYIFKIDNPPEYIHGTTSTICHVTNNKLPPGKENHYCENRFIPQTKTLKVVNILKENIV